MSSVAMQSSAAASVAIAILCIGFTRVVAAPLAVMEGFLSVVIRKDRHTVVIGKDRHSDDGYSGVARSAGATPLLC